MEARLIMGLFKRECSICLSSKCRGHTTSTAKADPRTVIRSYQSKPGMTFGKTKKRR
jgi:hypothetical protein